jgi:hypothetical protein
MRTGFHRAIDILGGYYGGRFHVPMTSRSARYDGPIRLAEPAIVIDQEKILFKFARTGMLCKLSVPNKYEQNG